jgi:sortase A
MARKAHHVGTLLIVAGIGTLLWAVLVWQWEDPFTAAYTRWQQHKLSSAYDTLYNGYAGTSDRELITVADARKALRREARAFRKNVHSGQAIGRIKVPRMGLNMVLVNGTDHDDLTRGPGRDKRTFMPGEGRLVYVAGHRTTYLAPFSHIDSLRSGDKITLSMPYATLTYSVTKHRVVTATDLSVLKSPRHEVLELQACHPRFFASHRYIAYAKLVSVELRGAAPKVSPTALAAAART